MLKDVKTTAEEQSFKFLDNQSSILRTVDTNNIIYNGVNVIVDKPKVGDVMCVTRYTDSLGELLPYNMQKVFFVSSSSIKDIYSLTHNDMNQLVIDTVGIVLKVMGNKALIRYKKISDTTYPYCNIKRRFQLKNDAVDLLIEYVRNGVRPTVNIITNDVSVLSVEIGEDSSIDYDNYTRKNLVDELNNSLILRYEFVEFSFDLIKIDSDEQTSVTDMNKSRVVLNSIADNISINYEGAEENPMSISISNVTANYLPMSDINQVYFLNSGFTRFSSGGCCKAALYDTGVNRGKGPDKVMTDINNIPGVPDFNGQWVVNQSDFYTNSYCQILRDNFTDYDEYIDSLMIKVPCNAITEENGNCTALWPSGKENTYKLATGSFSTFGQSNKLTPLYPAAYYCASLNVNGPGLTAGNWWLPSGAEMVEIMKDVTYKTSKNGEGNLVEKLCLKYSEQYPSEWSVLDPSDYYITSDIKLNSINSIYYGGFGMLSTIDIEQNLCKVIPITIYEF